MKSAQKLYFWVVLPLFLSSCFSFHHPKRRIPPIDNQARPSAKFAIPLKKVIVLSKFGPRGRRYHTGIDIRGRKGGGDKVFASRGGRVTKAGKGKGYGKMVVIKHADGFISKYAHLKKFMVKKGQKVKKRQLIGIVGKTGRATTPHLHFEILTPQNRFMNPGPLIFRK